jgi:hypothetical protein
LSLPQKPGTLFGLSALLALALLAAGCGNPYRKNYVSTVNKWPLNTPSRILPPSGAPKLLTSTDTKADALSMLENGYLMVGRASFRDSRIDEEQALEQAGKVGAAAVMVNNKFISTLTESVPVGEWIPDKYIRTTERSILQEGSATPQVYERESTTVIEGEYRTRYVNQNTDVYDYEATFWAKSKPPVFGVFVRELDDAAKAAIQSNKGVIVKAVVKDSPAFDSDILRGDVLVGLGGEEIRHPDQFFDLVARNGGKTVTVSLFRSNQKKTVKVKLGTE